MKTCGIYSLSNSYNGKVYVGQSVHIERRITTHSRLASSGSQFAIHRAIRKYGNASFTVRVLATCSVDELNDLEVFWVSRLSAFGPSGYNLSSGGSAPVEISLETRKKHSVNGSKNPSPVSHMEKMRLGNIGRVRSMQSINKQKATMVERGGYRFSDSQKQKLSDKATGRKMSEETKLKLSEAGMGRVASPASRAKVSAKLKGRVFPHMIGNKHMLGKEVTESTRIKTSRRGCEGSMIACNDGHNYLSKVEASIGTGVSKKLIYHCCVGNMRQSGGFTFQYVPLQDTEVTHAKHNDVLEGDAERTGVGRPEDVEGPPVHDKCAGGSTWPPVVTDRESNGCAVGSFWS